MRCNPGQEAPKQSSAEQGDTLHYSRAVISCHVLIYISILFFTSYPSPGGNPRNVSLVKVYGGFCRRTNKHNENQICTVSGISQGVGFNLSVSHVSCELWSRKGLAYNDPIMSSSSSFSSSSFRSSTTHSVVVMTKTSF